MRGAQETRCYIGRRRPCTFLLSPDCEVSPCQWCSFLQFPAVGMTLPDQSVAFSDDWQASRLLAHATLLRHFKCLGFACSTRPERSKFYRASSLVPSLRRLEAPLKYSVAARGPCGRGLDRGPKSRMSEHFLVSTPSFVWLLTHSRKISPRRARVAWRYVLPVENAHAESGVKVSR